MALFAHALQRIYHILDHFKMQNLILLRRYNKLYKCTVRNEWVPVADVRIILEFGEFSDSKLKIYDFWSDLLSKKKSQRDLLITFEENVFIALCGRISTKSQDI